MNGGTPPIGLTRQIGACQECGSTCLLKGWVPGEEGERFFTRCQWCDNRDVYGVEREILKEGGMWTTEGGKSFAPVVDPPIENREVGS